MKPCSSALEIFAWRMLPLLSSPVLGKISAADDHLLPLRRHECEGLGVRSRMATGESFAVDAASKDYCVTTLRAQGCTSQRAKRFLPRTGVLVKPVICLFPIVLFASPKRLNAKT